MDRLPKRMSELRVAVLANTEKLMRKTAIAADQAVVLATPVDKGVARANWRLKVGSADTGVDESNTNFQAALLQNRANVMSYKAGQSIWLSNNLPYINRLNNGYSAQAPVNFVRQAVKQAAGAIKGVSIITGKGL